MPGLVRKRAPQFHRASANRWVCSDLLSQTPWTQTYAARPANQGGGEQFAIKLARNDLTTDQQRQLAAGLLRREAAVGRTVQHRHVGATLGAETGIAGSLILIQPLLRGKPLDPCGLAASLASKLWIVRQAAEALAALHRARWLHGDVTPAAIWITPQGHVTLGELGWCRRLGSQECHLSQTRFSGHLRYAAPECFDDAGSLTAAADIYSLGAILFELLSQRPIFAAYEGAELVAAKRMLASDQFRPGEAPYGLASLLARMLSRDPLRRPTAQELIERLLPLEIAAIATPAAS